MFSKTLTNAPCPTRAPIQKPNTTSTKALAALLCAVTPSLALADENVYLSSSESNQIKKAA